MIAAVTKKKRRPRPLPPVPSFSLSETPDDNHLHPKDVAGFKRQSLSWTEKCRLDASDGLEWTYVNGSPRCIAGSLKAQLAAAGSSDKPPPPPMRAKKDGLSSLRAAGARRKALA